MKLKIGKTKMTDKESKYNEEGKADCVEEIEAIRKEVSEEF